VRFEVLINGGAGSVDEDHENQEVAAIQEAMARAGAEARVRMVDPEELPGLVREVWDGDQRPDAVLVAGGDGTVNCAASVAVGTDVVIGVLPLGTFNHFAKDLGVPEGLDEAVAALVSSEVRAVDVGEVNGRVFVNNSLLGFYPDLVTARDQAREHRGWGKVRAVPVAATQVMRKFPLHRLALSGPGYDRPRTRAPFVFIGNGVYDNANFGVHERADLVDGVLGVSVARVVSRWGLVRTVVRALVSGSDRARDLDVVELPELTVRSHTKRMRVSLDGEVCWLDLPLQYRCRPKALNVLAPVPPVDPEKTDPQQVVAEA